MMTDLKEFTIVSISYNNDGIYNTVNSLTPVFDAGGKMIIQNGGRDISIKSKSVRVFNEQDSGIYDGLNKGISKVRTRFFMLLHAGDVFIGNTSTLYNIIKEMERSSNCISLNSQFIGSRLHSSRYWRPWMINFGAQPPHLPAIYRSESFKKKQYSLEIPIIADFDFFLNQVDWQKAQWNNELLVKMETGGATSGGFQSFTRVSKYFIQSYGLRGILMAITRLPFKLIQAIQ